MFDKLASVLSHSCQVISNNTKCSWSGHIKMFWVPFRVVFFDMDHLKRMLISGLTRNLVKHFTDNGRKWRHPENQPITSATPRLAFFGWLWNWQTPLCEYGQWSSAKDKYTSERDSWVSREKESKRRVRICRGNIWLGQMAAACRPITSVAI